MDGTNAILYNPKRLSMSLLWKLYPFLQVYGNSYQNPCNT